MAIDHFKIDKGLTLKGQPADPSTPVDGDFLYNETLERFRFRQNGAWVSLGAGNVEQALLYQLLSDNGMEEIAFDSFDGDTTSIVKTASVLNLSQNTTEGRYDINGGFTDIVYWDGWRAPDSGQTGTVYTETASGTAITETLTDGEFILDDTTSGSSNGKFYTFTPSADFTNGDALIEWQVRIPDVGAYAAIGSDQSPHVAIQIGDGSRIIRGYWVREGGVSGTRQLIITNDSLSVINDINGSPARINVSWDVAHNYKFYKRGTNLLVYVDNELKLIVPMANGTSSSTRLVRWGVLAVTGTDSTSYWKFVNFQIFNNSLETKVLGYRGTIAFEGDGNPTSATSAGTIQESSSGLFLEDLWNQWAVSGSATFSSLNAGTLRSARRIAQSGAQSGSYSISNTEYSGLTNMLLQGGSVSVQGKVTFSTINTPVAAVDSIIQPVLSLVGSNKAFRVVYKKKTTTTGELHLGYREGSSHFSMADEGIGNGEGYPIEQGETVTIDLRRIGNDKIQMLINGKVQHEANIEDVPSITSLAPAIEWGGMANLTVGDSMTTDWDFVRASLNQDFPFLPKSPVQEYVTSLDLVARECYVAYSSDGLNWTFPQKVSASGVADLVIAQESLSSGYPHARIMISSESGAQLQGAAILFNSSFGAAGLPARFIKTFDSSEIPSEPADTTLSHGMGVASDEIHVFGGTEFLIPTLDWEYIDADNILIKNAVTGVPYVVQRVGFSFDRSQDNSDRLTTLEEQYFFLGTPVTGLASDTITDIPDASVTLQPGTYVATFGGFLRTSYSAAPTQTYGRFELWDESSLLSAGTPSVPMPYGVGGSNSTADFRYAETCRFTLTQSRTIRLRVAVGNTGGTVTGSGRRAENQYLFIQRVRGE